MVLHGGYEFQEESVPHEASCPRGCHLLEPVHWLEQKSFSGLPSSVGHGEPQLAAVGDGASFGKLSTGLVAGV